MHLVSLLRFKYISFKLSLIFGMSGMVAKFESDLLFDCPFSTKGERESKGDVSLFEERAYLDSTLGPDEDDPRVLLDDISSPLPSPLTPLLPNLAFSLSSLSASNSF